MAIVGAKVLLWVQDMRRARGFWEEGLGMACQYGDDDWTELVLGSTVSLALHGGHDGSRQGSSLSLTTDDLDALLAQVESLGGTITRPAQDQPGEGIRLAEFADPEGNLVGASQRLGG